MYSNIRHDVNSFCVASCGMKHGDAFQAKPQCSRPQIEAIFFQHKDLFREFSAKPMRSQKIYDVFSRGINCCLMHPGESKVATAKQARDCLHKAQNKQSAASIHACLGC